MKEKTQNHGITLTTLIITVIILLILAGVGIGLLGGDGLIQRARDARLQAEIDNEKELVEVAAVRAATKNRYGNITVEELQQELEGDATVGIIRKKIIATINDSQRMYYVDDEGNVAEYEYFDLGVMENGYVFYNRMADYKANILTVTVLDNMNVPENAYEVFDVSKAQNESVKAWLVENQENTGMYDLYIGGNEGVEIEDCNSMFAYYSNCISIDLSNLYTDNVKSFAAMFSWDTKLQTIDLSNIDTSNATSMYSMFNKCISLANLDVSKFNTSNVTSMSAMFYNCPFSTIDVSNFDTSKVTLMNEMFRQCNNLKELDLSSFDTSSLVRSDFMFYSAYNIKTIYVSDKWNNDKVTNSSNMFYGCTSLVGAINFDSSKTDMTYANYEIGYFTYKAAE